MDEYLYKYYSFDERGYSISNLKEGCVCFNNLNNFNDPFEGFGAFKFSETEEEKKYWESIGQSDINEKLGKRFSEDEREVMNFRFRVACFTNTYTNPLMWAHYANSHTGFCVGYLKSDIKDICDKLDKINYSNRMPQRNINNNEDISEKFKEIIYTKSSCWDYENEWRAVYEIKKKNIIPSDIDEYINKEKDYIHLPGKEGYVKTDSVMRIKCNPQVVYLGLKSSEANRKELIKIANENKLKINFMKMELNEYKFIKL